jgi:hypothetical protein
VIAVISPILFLSILIAATLAATATHLILRQIQMKRLRQLAARWQMHYTPGDRFKLSNRLAPRLGVPGAAMIRVQDVIYGREGESYRYYFTANYTTGVLKRKVDERAVCTLTELKDRDRASADLGPLQTATEGLTILEQYENLQKTITSKP